MSENLESWSELAAKCDRGLLGSHLTVSALRKECEEEGLRGGDELQRERLPQ